jgi:hypothetical protein
MSGANSTASRHTARALVVGNAALRSPVVSALAAQQISAFESDDPYVAMAELCRRPLLYKAIVLSLQSLYREELAMIPAIKRSYRHLEVWVCDIDGRSAALAEAMRLGVDGLLGEEGLHRIGGDRGPGAGGSNSSGGSPAPQPLNGHIATSHSADAPSPEPARSLPALTRTTGDSAPAVVRAAPMISPTAGSAVSGLADVQQPLAATAARRVVEQRSRSAGISANRDEAWDDSVAPASAARGEPERRTDEVVNHGEPVLTADELRALLNDHGGV